MKVSQVYELTNTITQELLGESGVVNEDLSNLVDIGKAIFDTENVENYMRKLMDQIGKIVFVDRPYIGTMMGVLMDSWEYGSVLEKIRTTMPQAMENQSWELNNGQSYDPHVFYAPDAEAKFYNSKTTFEFRRSIADIQLKSAFQNGSQQASFFSMLETSTRNAQTIRTEGLIRRCVTNFMGEVFYDAFGGDGITGKTGIRAVNLLYKYNTETGSNLTVSQAMTSTDFLKYASKIWSKYVDHLTSMSTRFNIGGTEKFTPRDQLHTIMLSDFARSADMYLYSDTFHDDYVKIPRAEVVPYWQAPGNSVNLDFTDESSIDVKTASGNTVKATGIVGVMFDRWALGVTNYNRRVKAQYTPNAEFTTYWYKQDASYFNDLDENCVVFYVA